VDPHLEDLDTGAILCGADHRHRAVRYGIVGPEGTPTTCEACKLAAARIPTPPALLTLAGHVLVAFTPKRPAGNGSYAYGVALFAAPAGEGHTHVVWTLIWNHEHEQWVREGGDYCFNLGQAVDAYNRRGGL
jgi:hypothetical protein